MFIILLKTLSLWLTILDPPIWIFNWHKNLISELESSPRVLIEYNFINFFGEINFANKLLLTVNKIANTKRFNGEICKVSFILKLYVTFKKIIKNVVYKNLTKLVTKLQKGFVYLNKEHINIKGTFNPPSLKNELDDSNWRHCRMSIVRRCIYLSQSGFISRILLYKRFNGWNTSSIAYP